MEAEEEKYFRARINSSALKEIINLTTTKVTSSNQLATDFKLKISKDGISIRVVDPAHVAMADLVMKKEAFDEYYASKMEIGIDADKLKNIIKGAKKNDTIKLEYNQKENKLFVTVGNLVRGMGLIDTAGMPDPKKPDLYLPGKIVLKSSDLNEGLKAAGEISDHLILRADKVGFSLHAEGDADTVDLNLEKELLYDLSVAEKCESKFSTDYFYNIGKNITSNSPVTLCLGNNNPIQMEFDTNTKIHACYLIAPRIESE